MYNDFKVANYSKALLSPELYARHLSRLFTGDVADGLTVSPGTGLQVVLAPGNAMLRYGSANVASARLVSLVANFNLSVGTPDLSNPRIDLVVVYVDNAVTLPSGTPTSANLDGLGVAKAKIVSGTPGATPVAPNASAIQSSVGAGNPYTVVGQMRVDVGVSVIAANKITDVRFRLVTSSDAAAWTLYSPSATPSSGAFTEVATPNCYYRKIGSSVHLALQVNVNNNGSASGGISVSLPFPAKLTGGRGFAAYGRENASSGRMLQGFIQGAPTALNIFDYKNDHPVGTSGVILMSVTYETESQ